MNTQNQPAGRYSSHADGSSPSYLALCELHDIQLVLDDRDPLTALRRLGRKLPSLGDRRTIVALGIPGDRDDVEICDALTDSLEWADLYVLYDLRDLRGRAAREVPQFVCNELPLDRVCVISSTPFAALQQAWRWARPLDRLVLIGDVADEALDRLPVEPVALAGKVARLRRLLEREVGGA
jgi:hypothetical protein